LIGGILLDSCDAPNYFRVFYTRRFFRIIPLYAAFLACVYVFVEVATPKAIDTYGWGLFDRHSFLPYLFFLQNFSMAASNYITFMGVTWSLVVEEQFYLVMPFLIRVFRF
jgi:peptidoglycan/LPS O-acetylase OafA/YrhL